MLIEIILRSYKMNLVNKFLIFSNKLRKISILLTIIDKK